MTVSERLVTPENAVIAACIVVAIPAAYVATVLVSEGAGFLTLLTAGVITPGHFRESWADRVTRLRDAALWGVVAAAVASFCYIGVALFLQGVGAPFVAVLALVVTVVLELALSQWAHRSESGETS